MKIEQYLKIVEEKLKAHGKEYLTDHDIAWLIEQVKEMNEELKQFKRPYREEGY